MTSSIDLGSQIWSLRKNLQWASKQGPNLEDLSIVPSIVYPFPNILSLEMEKSRWMPKLVNMDFLFQL